jgi:hypothetical protein
MNVSDKELLELAAKAAGYVIVGEVDAMVVQPGETKAGGYVIRNDRGGDSLWNPLLDDGDAFRLSTKLFISINFSSQETRLLHKGVYLEGFFRNCDCDSVRVAIVKVAAEVGRMGL